MQVSSLDELKQACKLNAPEVLITDEDLARRVRIWQIIRTSANIAVVFILGIGIFAWVNPLEIPELNLGGFRIARQVLLGIGVGLLFLEYLLPGTRVYKIAGREPGGLKLVNRRK